jgi:pimeloyl-ACP methyl ester carboxylesterase
MKTRTAISLCLAVAVPLAARAQEPAATRGFDARLTQYAYPFPVAMAPVRAQQQDLEMAYMDVPAAVAAANGRTVLLLHGKNFSAAYWAPTIRALTAAGYRVIAPDEIGFGKSSKPEHFQYSFQQLAVLTRTLLDRLGVRTTAVVGHSMGGMLATRFALMFPDRVERLVLVNPIGLEDWKRWVPYRTVDELFASERAATPESVRAYMRENYFAGQWRPEYEPLIEIQAGWLLGPDHERMAWTSALTTDMCFTQPVVHEFGDIKVPTLLVIGQRDRTAIGKGWAPAEVKARLGNYPELGRQARAAIPGAQLVEIADAGHLPQVEQFEAYRRALEQFLAAGVR